MTFLNFGPKKKKNKKFTSPYVKKLLKKICSPPPISG